jgi:hypothetical protein
VYLALARRRDGKEEWFVVSDEPTDFATFAEYGWRFDIEENFLDDKSNGFQLELSLIRSATALEGCAWCEPSRRCLWSPKAWKWSNKANAGGAIRIGSEARAL